MQALRGFVFSVMASSAFYPIIVKIFQVGWSRANTEYGASYYVLTIFIYLCSVTVYAVSIDLSLPKCIMLAQLFGLADTSIAESNRRLETWTLRYLGPITPDIPRWDGNWVHGSLLGVLQGRRSLLLCEARPMSGLSLNLGKCISTMVELSLHNTEACRNDYGRLAM